MRFDLFIDDANVRACYTGKTARIYREQFGKDILEDLSESSIRFYELYGQIAKEDLLDLTDKHIFASLCVKAVGAEQLEKLTWASIFPEGSTVLLFAQWRDSIENYQIFLLSAVLCFQYMIGNLSIVQPTDNEEAEEEKKRT